MKKQRNTEVSDLRTNAADAKAALLKNYLAAKEAAEPTRLARQAERLAIAEARETRRVERERTKREELASVAAEAAERAAAIVVAAKAEIDARELAGKNRIARVIEDEAARKMERDRRYANRKARQA